MRTVTPIPATEVNVGDVLESWGFDYRVTRIAVHSHRVSIWLDVDGNPDHDTLCQVPVKQSLRRVN
jgi:hypothetical protein